MDRKEIIDWISTILAILGIVMVALEAIIAALDPAAAALVGSGLMIKCLKSKVS